MEFNKEKHRLLMTLEKEGVVRETMPVHDGYGGVAYWSYKVLQPQYLPEQLKEEFKMLGEIRV